MNEEVVVEEAVMMVYTEEAVVNTKRHITEAMHLDAVMVVEAVRTVVTEVSHITKERWW